MSTKTKEWAQHPNVLVAREKTAQAFGYVADKSKEAYDKTMAHPKVQEWKAKLNARMRPLDNRT